MEQVCPAAGNRTDCALHSSVLVRDDVGPVSKETIDESPGVGDNNLNDSIALGRILLE